MAGLNSERTKARRIGVDTGGTFTDFVCLEGNHLVLHKCRSTAEDPSLAILEGIRALCEETAAPEIVHGSTVATNAVLERKGARVAMVVTAGFEDVIQIGRQTRPELYNLFVPARRPLVETSLVFGLPERLDASGRVLEPINRGALNKLTARLGQLKADVVAVCLLHSYSNPAHELQVAEHLR